MKKKQEQNVRIKVKKISIRGDEVAILFFSLVSLAFLFISFFRLFAAGKLFDDFIFLFLFGWSKYLVYLALFIIILPICFNYYFRFKFSFVLVSVLTLFAISWLVANISLAKQNNNIWWKIGAYQFKDLSNYFQEWWNGTIINNYHGFFAKPFSFTNWTDVNSFFPSYAAGGIIANFLITLIGYSGFLTNFILNLIVLLIAVSWMFFAKPWLFFISFAFLFKPIINLFRKKKIVHISEKSLETKTFLDFQEEYQKVSKVSVDTSSVKVKQEKQEEVKPKNKEIIIHKVIQESGNLTPFGKINKDQTIEINSDEEIN